MASVPANMGTAVLIIVRPIGAEIKSDFGVLIVVIPDQYQILPPFGCVSQFVCELNGFGLIPERSCGVEKNSQPAARRRDTAQSSNRKNFITIPDKKDTAKAIILLQYRNCFRLKFRLFPENLIENGFYHTVGIQFQNLECDCCGNGKERNNTDDCESW